MSCRKSRGNKDDGGSNNESRGIMSKIVTVACAAVAAVALVGQGNDDDGNESESTVLVSKVVIAASGVMAADFLVDRLFALMSASGSGSQYETTEDDDNGDDTWICPPDGWIKCNVDGSAPSDKASGCGGIFRDSTGLWKYGFARSFDRCTSSAAELEGIYTGLDIALKQGFHKLILETDSLTAADVVNNNNGASPRRQHEKILVRRIRNLLENKNWDVKPTIVHSKEDGNKVADWLANLSHGLEVGDQMELPKPPDGCHSCQKLVLEDMARLAKTKAGRSN